MSNVNPGPGATRRAHSVQTATRPDRDGNDPRLDSPAARRNSEPILAALRERARAVRSVLEIGSGSGQHAACFARALPWLRWQPTDRGAEHFASIEAWARDAGVEAPLAPRVLDVESEPWPIGRVDWIFSANLLHIAAWSCALALLRGARRHLASGGELVLYGPFFVDGETPAPSNLAFDAELRARNPAWGIRELGALEAAAAAQGLALAERLALPANNQILIFRRTADEPAL